MGEKDFQQAVLEELAAIKTHQQYFAEGLTIIRQHGERITATEQSVKSAHHRIDGIYAAAGIVGGAAGWIMQYVSSIWKGGHQ